MAWVANRSTSVRKPIAPINSELPSGNPGIGATLALRAKSVMRVSAQKDVAPRRGADGAPRKCRRGSWAGGGSLFGGLDVGRQEDGRLVAVVDPIVADTVGLAAQLAGPVRDR